MRSAARAWSRPVELLSLAVLFSLDGGPHDFSAGGSSLPVLDHSRRQLEALLDVSEIIAQHRDLETLLHELAVRLHSVVDSDFLTLLLYDPVKNVMRLHVLETRTETGKPLGMEHPVDGSPLLR